MEMSWLQLHIDAAHGDSAAVLSPKGEGTDFFQEHEKKDFENDTESSSSLFSTTSSGAVPIRNGHLSRDKPGVTTYIFMSFLTMSVVMAVFVAFIR